MTDQIEENIKKYVKDERLAKIVREKIWADKVQKDLAKGFE